MNTLDNPMIVNLVNVYFPEFPDRRLPKHHAQIMELDALELKLDELHAQMCGMDNLAGYAPYKKARSLLNDAVNAVDDLVESLGLEG
jgi:hypothetical protein